MHTVKIHAPRWVVGSALGLALGASAAYAQTAEETADDSPQRGGLAEIIVTAQKRSENLQEVPIAITAVTADSLATAGVSNIESLSASVPGMTITRQSAATMIYLRGIGTTGGQSGQEGAVATFVDGVYQPSMSGSTFSFNNIERIEVLKGPQGTLYGRNATGGAVNVITRDPSYDATAKFDIGYGNRNTVEASAYVSGGLSDTVAIDIAGLYNNVIDGFGRNTITGGKVNTRRDWGVRSKLLFEPSEQTKIILAGDYSQNSGSYGVSFNPVVGTMQTLLGPVTADYGNRYNVRSDVDPSLNTENWGFSGRIQQAIGGLTLTSITSYRKLDQFQNLDLDAGPLPLAEANLQETNSVFTQELQLANGKSSSLQWIVGLFYLNGKAGYDPFDLRGQAFGFDPTLAALGADGQYINDEQKTKSYAIFGQATYALSDRVNITAGARYTIDERKLDYDFFFTAPAAPGGLIPVASGIKKETFKEPTWRLALDYKVTDDVLLYGSYSRGFKSGVYNLTSPLDAVVKPEKLDAFEIGLKNELFDRTLRLNLAGFYYKYSNIQLTIIRGGAQTLINAAKAEVKGAEAEIQWAPTEGLVLNGGLQYIDGEYTDFPLTPVTTLNPVFPFGVITTPTATKGLPLIRTPKFSANLTADYTLDVGGGDELGFNVAYQYSGSYAFEPDGRLRQKAYSLVNGSVRYKLDDAVTLRLWGRNIFDKKYYSQVTSTFLGDLQNVAFGRQYGFSIGYEF